MFMPFEVAKPLLGIYSREITFKRKRTYIEDDFVIY